MLYLVIWYVSIKKETLSLNKTKVWEQRLTKE